MENRMLPRAARSTKVWLGLSGLAAVVSAIALASITSISGVETRFQAAVAHAPAARPPEKAGVPRDGTEEYWLGLGPNLALTPVVFDRPLSVGSDLPKGIDATGRDLEIVSIRRIEDDGHEQLLLVTCKDRSSGAQARLVKVLLQMPSSSPAAGPHVL